MGTPVTDRFIDLAIKHSAQATRYERALLDVRARLVDEIQEHGGVANKAGFTVFWTAIAIIDAALVGK